MYKISSITAPDGLVITAILLGRNGISFLNFSSKNPLDDNFFFLSSNSFNRAPSPSISILYTI